MASRAIVLGARKLDFTTETGAVQRSEVTYVLDEPFEQDDQKGYHVYRSGAEGFDLFDSISEVPGLYDLTEASRSRMRDGRAVREVVVTGAELVGSLDLPFEG